MKLTAIDAPAAIQPSTIAPAILPHPKSSMGEGKLVRAVWGIFIKLLINRRAADIATGLRTVFYGRRIQNDERHRRGRAPIWQAGLPHHGKYDRPRPTAARFAMSDHRDHLTSNQISTSLLRGFPSAPSSQLGNGAIVMVGEGIECTVWLEGLVERAPTRCLHRSSGL